MVSGALLSLVPIVVWWPWSADRHTFFGRAQEPRPLAALSAVGWLGSPGVGVPPGEYSRRLGLGARGI